MSTNQSAQPSGPATPAPQSRWQRVKGKLEPSESKALAFFCAAIGLLSGIAQFVGPFSKSGPDLILKTVLVAGAGGVLALSMVVLVNRRKKLNRRIATTVLTALGALLLVGAVGGGMGYLIGLSTGSGSKAAPAPVPHTPAATATGPSLEPPTSTGATANPTATSVYLDFVKHASNGPERAAALYGAIASSTAGYAVTDTFNEGSIAHGLMTAPAYDQLWSSGELTCGQGAIDGAVASYEVHHASGAQVRVLLYRGTQRLAQFPTLTFDPAKMVAAVSCQSVRAFDTDIEPPHPEVVASALGSTLARNGTGDGTTNTLLAPGAMTGDAKSPSCLSDNPRWWVAYGTDWTSTSARYIFYAADRSGGSNEGHLAVDGANSLINRLQCGQY